MKNKKKFQRVACLLMTVTLLPIETVFALANEVYQSVVESTPTEQVVMLSDEQDNETPAVIEYNNLTLELKSESDTTISVSWNDIFEETEGYYDVYLNSKLVADDIFDSTYTISNLNAASAYEIKVNAVDSDGNIIKESDTISAITDLVITQDTALWEETTVQDLYINSGTFNLNEQTIHVKGNVIINSGTLNINGGQMFVDGDLRLQKENIASDGTKSYSYASYAYLRMINEDDYVLVNGDFVVQSRCDYIDYLTNGVLEVKGNFTQNKNAYYTTENNFYATQNHKVIFSGAQRQEVNFNGTTSKFAILELQNFSAEGVHFNQALNADTFIPNGCKYTFSESGIIGWTLTKDQVYDGDLLLVGGTLDLNGHKLTVNGNLTQSGGSLDINGGELEVTGDYRLQNLLNEASNGILNMTNESDIVKIHGSFATRSVHDHTNYLTAGTMEIGGDLYQYSNSNYNFKTSGTHKVILNGNGKQNISFASRSNENYARFNSLEITNTDENGVEFLTHVWINKELKDTDSVLIGSHNIYLGGSADLLDNVWSHSLRINQNRTLDADWDISGSLYIESDTFNLNGYIVDVGENLIFSGGTLYVNNGNLLISGDFRLQSESINSSGIKSYSYGSGYLRMNHESDYVLVNGDFVVQARYVNTNYLTNGVLEVKGNFTQNKNAYYTTENNFYATNNHKVVLSGAEKQVVDFNGTTSRFAILELENKSEEGIVINQYFNVDTLIKNTSKISFASGEIFGWTLKKDETIEGDLYLGYETLDLNGYKLTVNGNLMQSGGIVLINGGELEVAGDYKLQTTSNGASTGVLDMTNESDIVKIYGSFETRSVQDHTNYLTAGTMEIGGDLYQYNNSSYNFKTSGTHKIMLNGTEKQNVSFASRRNENYARFNSLEIINTSEQGIEFLTHVWVNKELKDTDSVVVNSQNIYLGGTAVLVDDSWSHDIRTNQNRTLDTAWEIGGSLYVESGTFKLNDNLNIAKSLYVSGGTLDLNGYTVKTEENLILSSGTLYINGGQLLIDGDLRLQSESINSSGIKSYSYGSGYLRMNDENDYILVNGDFIVQARYVNTSYLTNGILEIKGNFTQNKNAYYTTENNFYATNNHKVILSGTEKQIVDFNGTTSRFATLELKNNSADGVIINQYFNTDTLIKNTSKISFVTGEIFGWTLTKDETIESDLYLGYETLDLNGHKLTINGNLIQSGGTVLINGGELEVTGDYKLQTTSNGASTGVLDMTNEKDIVKIHGSFATRSVHDHTIYLTAGTMEIGGDLYQYNNSAYNFKTSGIHKVILNGTKKQNISFAYGNSESYSRFNILEITNNSLEGVDFITSIWIYGELKDTDSVVTGSRNIYLGSLAILSDNSWSYDLKTNQNRTLDSDWIVGGSLYIDGGTFNLNGNTVNVKENLILSSGTLYINSGELLINGDLRLQRESINSSGIKSYSYVSSAYLRMINEDDYILVNGDFVLQTRYVNTAYLTNGVLEVKGNFTQNKNAYYTTENNFYATVDHKVILSGTEKQIVDFNGSTSRFSILEITNTSEDGIYVASYFNYDTLITNGNHITFANGEVLGWKLTEDVVYDGDIYLIGDTLDLNGYKLTVNGNFTQSGGTVFVNGGELEVTGDYKLQTLLNGASNGILNMTNESDIVRIHGSFASRSIIDHTSYLTAGTMEIGGDLYQYNNSAYNFKTSGTHKVILNGTNKQTISFAYGSSEGYSRFNSLEIENTSKDGVIFITNVWIYSELKDTSSFVIGSNRIYLGSSAILSDNTWSYDLRISQNRTLDSDWLIGGSLLLTGGTFNVSGRKLEVKGTLAVGPATLFVNNGQIIVGKDLRIQNPSIQNDGTEGYEYSSGYLKMINESDFIRVNRNFITQARYSHNGYLTNGILEIKGNFTQITYSSTENFYADNNHRTILSGNKLQKVNFASEQAQFNILEINKTLSIGYEFSRIPVWNELIETAMDLETPTAPENLKSNLQNINSIHLSWDESTDNTSVEGYDVYRNGVRIGSTAKTEFIDDNLKANTAYTYYVVAYDIMRNESEWSNILETRTDVDADAPTQPTSLKIKEQTSAKVVLTWTASTDNSKVEGYYVYRNDVQIAKVNGTSFTDNTISEDLYVYYVKAFDDTNNLSKASESITVDTKSPSVPVLTLENSSNTQAQLSWTCEDNLSVAKYEIYRNGVRIYTTTGNTYTNIGLQYGNTYEYYIIAYDEAGNASEKSNIITVYTGEDTENPVVTDIMPRPGRFSKSIPLVIYVKDNAGVAKVLIQTSFDEENWTDMDGISVERKTSASVKYDLSIADFEDGSIFVRAIAIDSKGNESDISASPVVEYLIDNTAPNAPKEVYTNLVNGQVEIGCTQPTDKDFSYFRIYKSESGTNTFNRVADNHRYLNYIDSKIELGKTYDYYITAVDTCGNESEKSEIISNGVVTDANKPEILSISPSNNKKIHENNIISISCRDNFMLDSLTVEFTPQGTENWEMMYTQKLSSNAEIVKFTLDASEFADGLYDVRIKTIDTSGNESDYYTLTYDYKSCSISAPKIFATEGGWQIQLNWTDTDDESMVGYNLYKRSANNNTFSLLTRTTNTTYTDFNVTAGSTYFYYAEAIDSYGNLVKGQILSATPHDGDEIEPVADAGLDLYGISGYAISFNGSYSFDNHYIESYHWDFGDGNTVDTMKASHTYANEGTYTVTLTVKDSAGNIGQDEITVIVYDGENYSFAEFQLVDSNTKRAVTNAIIHVEFSETGDTIFSTDYNGCAKIIAPNGYHHFSFYKDGYLPVSYDADVSKGFVKTLVEIESGELVTGKIEVERLEIQEIENLGIDIKAPENQYVYRYEIEAEYNGYTGKLTLTTNGTGELIDTVENWTVSKPSSNGSSSSGGSQPSRNKSTIKTIPSADPSQPPTVAILNVSTDISWLKEFFEVKLTLINNADYEFSIQDSVAKLNLPKGMSLATTNNINTANRTIGTLYGGQTSAVSWIVRGDTAGDYEISANFSGYLMPFNESVNVSFKTDEPVKVYGGDALKLEITNNVWSETDNIWTTSFKLTNVSDITVYNPSINYSGYSEFTSVRDMVITYPNGVVELIPWEGGNPNKSNIERFLPALLKEGESFDIVLKPGESIRGYFTAKK